MQEEQNHLIDSLSELKEQSIEAFSHAKRSIQIYSKDLDPRILNNRDIEQACLRFIKKSKNSRINILIYDENLLRGIDHRLVALTQRFSSFIEIRLVPKDYHEIPYGYYLIDDREIIYRSNTERYEAERRELPEFLVKDKSKMYDSIWQSARSASFLRALHL